MRKLSDLRKFFFRVILCGFALFILAADFTLAKKTDVVTLKNGDRITGDIKRLERGKLEYSSFGMKTIYIDWLKVNRISSKKALDIETEDGRRFKGTLGESDEDGKIVIITISHRLSFDMVSIIRMVPLEGRFWKRFKGSLDFGFNYQKASSLKVFTSGANVTYHTPKWEASLSLDAYLSDQEGVDKITRNSVGLGAKKFFPRKWALFLYSQVQQNSELGLDQRTILGGGGGRYIINTNRIILMTMVGLMATNERYVDSESSKESLESLLTLDFQTFKYQSPSLDFSASVMVFANITDFGRFRIELECSIEYEVFKNFYFSIGVFDNFDSRPPSEDVPKNDYAVNTAIKWKFK